MGSGVRRRRGALAAAVAAVALAPTLVLGQSTQYRATLSGANEVPAVTTTATGTFSATLDASGGGSLTWSLTTTGLTGGVTAAHIHLGAPSVNGAVVVNLVTAPTAGDVSATGVSAPGGSGGAAGGQLGRPGGGAEQRHGVRERAHDGQPRWSDPRTGDERNRAGLDAGDCDPNRDADGATGNAGCYDCARGDRRGHCRTGSTAHG
ncbi:MAG: CHRD domain-containing protein [Dehalococcoidia bacterium]|nr:CHRD domain-containing protein [Dehalococcoidia bacterium]MSQ36581.1 CHRD domain-containing protein [Dehalococcoidia bacterium]